MLIFKCVELQGILVHGASTDLRQDVDLAVTAFPGGDHCVFKEEYLC